ncbi:MAG: hypothetical protein EAZ34_06375 [Polaromonas sp.]|nr:MAG: hypothetical protein EAZ34_06375 [Polaromonas sp.]
MHKLNSKRVLTAALTAALLAGCGGGSDSSASSAGGGDLALSDISQNINTVFAYVSRLIADNGENTDPTNINGFTLATDDTASPTLLP